MEIGTIGFPIRDLSCNLDCWKVAGYSAKVIVFDGLGNNRDSFPFLKENYSLKGRIIDVQRKGGCKSSLYFGECFAGV